MVFTNIDAAAGRSPDLIHVALVPARQIGGVWADCAHAIGRALVEYMPGALTVEDCRQMCERGQNQLWLAYDGGKIVGCAISEAVMQPQGLALRCFLTDYAASWSLHLTRQLEDWALCLRATTIVTVAPAGLQTLLGRPIATYWRTIDGPFRDVPQTAIPMPSEKVH